MHTNIKNILYYSAFTLCCCVFGFAGLYYLSSKVYPINPAILLLFVFSMANLFIITDLNEKMKKMKLQMANKIPKEKVHFTLTPKQKMTLLTIINNHLDGLQLLLGSTRDAQERDDTEYTIEQLEYFKAKILKGYITYGEYDTLNELLGLKKERRLV